MILSGLLAFIALVIAIAAIAQGNILRSRIENLEKERNRIQPVVPPPPPTAAIPPPLPKWLQNPPLAEAAPPVVPPPLPQIPRINWETFVGVKLFAWIGGFALSSFFTLIHQAPIFAAVVSIVGERRRALAISVVLLGASLIGNAIGPSAVGLLNDLLHAEFGDYAIRYSLLIIAATPVLAAACFWRAAMLYGKANPVAG